MRQQYPSLSGNSRYRKPLLHPSAFEEARVRRVLFDICRFALFVGVLRVVFLVRRVSRGLSILGNALVAAICGWDRRHATGHWIFLLRRRAANFRPKRRVG
jgi:hypothetical protein